jgi:hypothetical protein
MFLGSVKVIDETLIVVIFEFKLLFLFFKVIDNRNGVFLDCPFNLSEGLRVSHAF